MAVDQPQDCLSESSVDPLDAYMEEVQQELVRESERKRSSEDNIALLDEEPGSDLPPAKRPKTSEQLLLATGCQVELPEAANPQGCRMLQDSLLGHLSDGDGDE
mmetsp:Transcript_91628/g.245473  ORF Transcript_91628/g.245473 Transcript_91628/m.245473 type:complete len:104 (-) Transcript_91628:6-317(-)